MPDSARQLLQFLPGLVALLAALAVYYDAARLHRAAYALYDHAQESHRA